MHPALPFGRSAIALAAALAFGAAVICVMLSAIYGGLW